MPYSNADVDALFAGTSVAAKLRGRTCPHGRDAPYCGACRADVEREMATERKIAGLEKALANTADENTALKERLERLEVAVDILFTQGPGAH